MIPPRFLADEDFRGDFVRATLRISANVDIVTVQQLGLAGTMDGEILEIAQRIGRVVLSHDVNTMIDAAVRRIESGQSIAGLLMVAQTAERRTVAEAIALVASASDADEWNNVIDFIPWNT